MEEFSANTVCVPKLSRQMDIHDKVPPFLKRFSFALTIICMTAVHISLDLGIYLVNSSWRSCLWRWKGVLLSLKTVPPASLGFHLACQTAWQEAVIPSQN